jgi:thioester reductase-like protein
MSAKQILITGADGYLGARLAKKFLASTDDRVLLWIRAGDEQEFQVRRERLNRRLNGITDRVSYHWGDLRSEAPFQPIEPEKISRIIHSAAVTRFNVDETTAQSVNVKGTEKMLRFANRCRSLESFGLLSTVYATGLRAGSIKEAVIEGKDGFANHYERSKWKSETSLLRDFDHLPWRILRVATVIADSEDGCVSQYNAFHNTLKLFYYGLLSLIPGKPETPVYFVTGDFVTDAVFRLMNTAPSQTIYHLAHTAKESLTLGELIDLAFEIFGQESDFRSRRILKPLYADAESFDLLAGAISSSIINQAVSSVAPFGRQLFIRKEIDNQNLVSALESYNAPDARQLIKNTCQYLLRTKWGKDVKAQ